MFDRIKPHAPILITAVLVAALTSGGPAIATAAFDAMNADKVDGKHAVGARASIADRAGKLVATNKSGLLPNNIISKAPNADTLDGLDSSAFQATPSDERFTVMYPLSNQTVGWMSVRGDASIREQSDDTSTVTKVGVGQYCLKAPGAREGAVGVLQNHGGGTGGTIRVSMGIGSFCNDVAGSNITVETFRG